MLKNAIFRTILLYPNAIKTLNMYIHIALAIYVRKRETPAFLRDSELERKLFLAALSRSIHRSDSRILRGARNITMEL